MFGIANNEFSRSRRVWSWMKPLLRVAHYLLPIESWVVTVFIVKRRSFYYSICIIQKIISQFGWYCVESIVHQRFSITFKNFKRTTALGACESGILKSEVDLNSKEGSVIPHYRLHRWTNGCFPIFCKSSVDLERKECFV